MDARAVSACDQAQDEMFIQEAQDASRARKQSWILLFVGEPPQAVGPLPMNARNFCSAVNAIPIGGIVAVNFASGPRNAERPKHREISARIGGVGIEERAIPVKKDCAHGKTLSVHDRRIVTEKKGLVLAIAERENVVALDREIIETGGVASPSGCVGGFRANNVRRSAHLHAAKSLRAINKTNFKLYGCAGRDVARCEEINSAGTDVASDKRNGNGFGHFADAREAQRE